MKKFTRQLTMSEIISIDRHKPRLMSTSFKSLNDNFVPLILMGRNNTEHSLSSCSYLGYLLALYIQIHIYVYSYIYRYIRLGLCTGEQGTSEVNATQSGHFIVELLIVAVTDDYCTAVLSVLNLEARKSEWNVNAC